MAALPSDKAAGTIAQAPKPVAVVRPAALKEWLE